MCVVVGCLRHSRRGSRFCGSCWALVPVETKLALDGMRDGHLHCWHWVQGDTRVADEDVRWFREFVALSWDELLNLAAQQAFETRGQRALDAAKALASAFTEESDDERDPSPD